MFVFTFGPLDDALRPTLWLRIAELEHKTKKRSSWCAVHIKHVMFMKLEVEHTYRK